VCARGAHGSDYRNFGSGFYRFFSVSDRISILGFGSDYAKFLKLRHLQSRISFTYFPYLNLSYIRCVNYSAECNTGEYGSDIGPDRVWKYFGVQLRIGYRTTTSDMDLDRCTSGMRTFRLLAGKKPRDAVHKDISSRDGNVSS